MWGHVGKSRVVIIRAVRRRLSRRSWLLWFLIVHDAKRHGDITSLIIHIRCNKGLIRNHDAQLWRFIGDTGRGNNSTVAVVAQCIKSSAIVIGGSIKELLLSSEWVLPIKDRWVPIHIACHDDMGQGLKFLICKRTQIKIGQTIANMEGKLIPIIGDNELTMGIHTAGTFINLIMKGLKLTRGKNSRSSHDSSKLVEDNYDWAMIAADSIGSTGDNRDLGQLMSIQTFNVNKTIRSLSNDATILTSKATISTTINQST